MPQSPSQVFNQISATNATAPDLYLSVTNSSAIDSSIGSYNASPSVDDVNVWEFDAIDSLLSSANNSVPESRKASFPSQLLSDRVFSSTSMVQTSPVSVTALDRFCASSSEMTDLGPGGAQKQAINGVSSPATSIVSVSSHDRSGVGACSPDDSSSSSPASPADDGWLSTLHIAAQKGHDRIVRMLMQCSMDCNEKDSDGRTPLMYAVIGDHEAVVGSLLAHGACIGETDHEQRLALHLAVLYRRESILRVLLEYHSERLRKPDIDIYDNTGRTPLHIAVEMGFESGVQMLLGHGANLHSKARKCLDTGNVP